MNCGPGDATIVWMMSDNSRPAPDATAVTVLCTMRTSESTLRAVLRTSDVPSSVPARSATTIRTRSRLMSTAATARAEGSAS
jgi:hypothetical protein